MSDLAAFSDQIASLIAAAAPSVVRIGGHRRRAASGVVRDRNLVVTNHHAVPREGAVPVILHDGSRHDATVIGRDPSVDLALLRLEVDLPVPPWEEAALSVGHLVFALGRTRSSLAAIGGIVGAVGDAWRTPLGGEVDRWIDVDASLRWGFTGGPLLDARGRVVGLNSAALTRGGTTLPTATVARVADRLRQGRQAGGAWLGIGVYPVALPAGSDQERAALVVAVEPGSPAEAAGLVLGDALLKVDGVQTRSVSEVAAALAPHAPGDEVTLTILRAGEVVEHRATLGQRP